MEFLNDTWSFLGALNWGRLVVAFFATVIAVVVGIWFPARMLESYTNQPLARWAWYVVGTLALAMIFISMYGYGHFWTSYAASDEAQQTEVAD